MNKTNLTYFWDRVHYLYGGYIFLIVPFLAGAYPETHFWTFILIWGIFSILFRTVYYLSCDRKGRWPMLFDFCYVAFFLFNHTIWFRNKDPEALATIFVISFGPLAMSSTMFDNRLIFHRTEFMAGMVLHGIPPIAMILLKHWIIPGYELNNTPQEDRFFVEFPKVEEMTSEEFWRIVVYNPFWWWVVWFVPYYICQVILPIEKLSSNPNGLLTLFKISMRPHMAVWRPELEYFGITEPKKVIFLYNYIKLVIPTYAISVLCYCSEKFCIFYTFIMVLVTIH